MARTKIRYSKIMSRPNAVRKERLAQGWLAGKFAQAVGITRSQLAAIEARKSGTSEATAVAIARLLNREFDELFEIVLPDQEEESTTDSHVAVIQ